MKKIRVYELAKEMGMENKDLFAKLIEWGYAVKSVSSTLGEGEAVEVRQRFSSSAGGAIAAEETTTAVETTTVAEDIDGETGSRTEVREKRIQAKGKTTIIRRRRKKMVEEVPEPEEEVVVEAAAEEVEETMAEPEVVAEAAPVEPAEEIAEATAPQAALPEEEKAPEAPLSEMSAPESEPVVEAEEPIDAADSQEAEQEEKEAVAVVEPEVEDKESEPAKTEAVAKESTEEKASEAEVKKVKTIQPDKRRQGLARVIKKSAIHIPVEEEKRPAPKRAAKGKKTKLDSAKGKAGKAGKAGEAGGPQVGMGGEGDSKGDDRGGKGKKGKRFVKFHHEPGAKGKKGGKRKGFSDVDMEDVAMAGGRLSTALKVGRGPRGGGKKQKQAGGGLQAAETKAIKKRIKIYETITIADLAHRMGVKANEVIAKLMGLGVMATLNQALDVDTATLVATDFGYEVEQAVTEELSIINLEDQESGGEEASRPPVVTVMGHVDHGKTSILDAIRNTDVAAGEAGGITQHIGAHYVRSAQGDVVFLDTPGHAAFTEMRSRGAKVTDVVVLVVAADDGVMDQTKEAINHAKAAEVPIVVAVNKIDKDDADPMRVKRELAEFDLVPEEWGGDTIYCETSAKQNIGINELLEQILLQAEMQELKADPKRKARGRVVEAHLHKGRGPVATILMQQGTLQVGQAFVVGEHYGKVRSLLNDKGRNIQEAGPSWPVEVQGLSGVPRAGDEFIVVSDDKMAKSVSAERQMKARESQLAQTSKISLDNLFEKLQEGDVKELKVLLRADVQGTLEAFGKSIEQLSTDEIRVKIILEGTGAVIDSDILLAAASDAIIIGFNVRPSTKVQEFASNENVEIRYYDVIYHALDDIRKAMTGMLEPTFVERVLGSVEVRETFSVPKIGTIAGCYVTDGKIERNAQLRLLRDSVVIYTGKLSSLRRFKDDVKEVSSGYECGIGIENYNDIKVGDVIEVFVLDEVAAEL